MNKKRVLVVSNIVFCDSTSGGRTISGFFNKWNKNNLAQLYFQSEIPTLDFCNNYLRITDFDVLNSILKQKQIGKIYNEADIRKDLITSRVDKGIKAKLYKLGRKRIPFINYFRDFIWNLDRWKNNKFENWINDFNPDIIFFSTGDFSFTYKIALYISNSRGIPLVSYICDDHYFNNKFSISPLYYYNRRKIKSTFEKMIINASNNIYIGDKIKNKYSNYFNTRGEVIMTSSELTAIKNKSESKTPIISYLGNVNIGRWKSLCEIGRVLLQINTKYRINIYSNITNRKILNHFNEKNGINYHGLVAYSKVVEIMQKSDIIIHVEDSSISNVNITRYSISTKIADALSCGTCLFAYGPNEVASIDYLKENDVACVVNNKDELVKTLKELVSNKKLQNHYINKAIKIAKNNHNINNNYLHLNNIIENSCK